jgi:hypothetical protein
LKSVFDPEMLALIASERAASGTSTVPLVNMFRLLMVPSLDGAPKYCSRAVDEPKRTASCRGKLAAFENASVPAFRCAPATKSALLPVNVSVPVPALSQKSIPLAV